MFDGVHRGHLEVIRLLRERAGGRPAVIVTFDEHPRAVLTGQGPSLLTGLEHRVRLLGRAGVDGVVVLPFREVSTWPAERFVHEVLVETLGASWVLVGENHRFGQGREGDLALLEHLGAEHGFRAEEVTLETGDGEVISSTAVRAALAAGDLERCAELLGRPLSYLAPVTRGDQRGRELGFPTANLALDPRVTPPPRGVYAARARVIEGEREGPLLPAVANVGRRPTFKADDPDLAEVHLLEGGRDLYGQILEVQFLERLRGEQRFNGPAELRAQIERDIVEAKRRLSSAPA